jgi:hypothetical protein
MSSDYFRIATVCRPFGKDGGREFIREITTNRFAVIGINFVKGNWMKSAPKLIS